MVIKDISAWINADEAEGGSRTQLSPRIGAAGLLVAAAHCDGRFTDVEKDTATAALMKLFHINNPDARNLRIEAEKELTEGAKSFPAFAAAAKALDREDQEKLMRYLWELVGSDGETDEESVFVMTVAERLEFTKAQAEALRPVEL